jgi:hypothetical protein
MNFNKMCAARANAEALFKPVQPTTHLSSAMQEYRAAAQSEQEKTRRLRLQRLAQVAFPGAGTGDGDEQRNSNGLRLLSEAA